MVRLGMDLGFVRNVLDCFNVLLGVFRFFFVCVCVNAS